MKELKNLILTRLQNKALYKKCAMNPIYFLSKYTYVQHPTRGKIKFKLYPFQLTTIMLFIRHSWNIIVKSRQLGISTLCAGYALWLMTFNRDKSILVIANKQDVAKNLIRKVRMMYLYLPDYLKLPIVTDNKQSIFFANDSFIKAESANPNAGVSLALSLLIIDLAAVLQESLFQSIFTAASPTLSTGGDFIILSTPRGVGGLFHKLWVLSLLGNNRFNPIQLPWDVHPERDQLFRDSQTKLMGLKKAKQLFDCDFSSSGDTVMSTLVLLRIKNSFIIDPILKLYNELVWIWKFPLTGKSYILSADVARGDGTDYSGFEILCVDDDLQAGEFKGKISTPLFAVLIDRFGRMYQNAFVVVLNATIGWSVIQLLITMKYPNLYYHKKDYKVLDLLLLARSIPNKSRDRQKDIPGFTTSSKSRPLIINKMVVMLLSGGTIIHSRRLFNLLWTFIWSNGRPEAMRGYNDDLVMSYAIGIWVRNTSYIIKNLALAFTKQRLGLFNSGLNVQRQSGLTINASGFFNARTVQSQDDLSTFDVGGLKIDLLEFYFNKQK